jgi:FKBP-type peptidyl-prolyl cis-trans isomerase
MGLAQRVSAEQQQERRQQGAEALKSGEAFLAENAAKAGVKTLPSGLQYKVIQSGSGASPKATDKVTVHYRGTLIDGTEFDSSYSRNKPATFGVNQVIPGWTEALQLMQEGDKWELYIPPKLAYGERGAGSRIPPNSTLIFEVELLSVGQ